MPWAAGAAVVGAALSADAASSAGKRQSGAAASAAADTRAAQRDSNALQWMMHQQGLQNQAPFLRSGQLAQSALLGGMGLGQGQGQGQPQAPGRMRIPGQPGRATTMGAVEYDAQGQPMVQNDNSGITPMAREANIDGIGKIGVQQLGASDAEMDQAGGTFANMFSERFDPSKMETDPSFDFRLKYGQRALESSAAARGMTGSGQNLADITNYGQEAASQEYSNMFNRFQTERTNIFNRLTSLAGGGQTAANTVGASGSTTGANIGSGISGAARTSGDFLTSGAAASAAGTMGAANAWNSGLNTATGNYMGWDWLNKQGKP